MLKKKNWLKKWGKNLIRIMQASWNPNYTGARRSGLKSTILMCYFHVIYSIKKKWKHKLRSEEWHALHKYIQDIQLSRNENERDSNWQIFRKGTKLLHFLKVNRKTRTVKKHI